MASYQVLILDNWGGVWGVGGASSLHYSRQSSFEKWGFIPLQVITILAMCFCVSEKNYDHIDFEYTQPLYVSIVNVNFTTDKFIFSEGSKFNLNPHLPLQIKFLKIFNAYLFVIYLYRICLIHILELTIKCYIWPTTLVQTKVDTIQLSLYQRGFTSEKTVLKNKRPSNFKHWV